MSLVRYGLSGLRSRSRGVGRVALAFCSSPSHSFDSLLTFSGYQTLTQGQRSPGLWPQIVRGFSRHLSSMAASQPLPDLDDVVRLPQQSGQPKLPHFTTADLYDANIPLADNAELRVLQPIFQIYGQRRKFAGPIVTLMVSEDNVQIHEVLDTPGNGRVLVIDAGAQMRRALVGGILAEKALKNGWAGILLNGCVRDVDDINAMDMGVRALASLPTKPRKLKFGLKHVPVNIGGILIHEGDWLYADADGILISKSQIFM